MVCPGRKKGSPLTFQQCVEKASDYYGKQMWVAALPYYGAMLELTERAVGVFHPQVGNILDLIATCYRKLGKIEEAIQCLRRVVIVREANNDGTPEKNREAFTTMGLLSEMYVEVGNIPLAKELLVKTEETSREAFGESSFERGRALVALAGCLERNEEHEEAEATLRTAIALDGYGLSSDPAEQLVSSNGYYNLGVILSRRGKFAEALEIFQICLRRKRAGGLAEDDPECTAVNNCIAELQGLSSSAQNLDIVPPPESASTPTP